MSLLLFNDTSCEKEERSQELLQAMPVLPDLRAGGDTNVVLPFLKTKKYLEIDRYVKLIDELQNRLFLEIKGSAFLEGCSPHRSPVRRISKLIS